MLAPEVKKVVHDISKTIENKSVLTQVNTLSDKELLSQYKKESVCLNDASILDKSICYETNEIITTPIKKAIVEKKVLTIYEWAFNQMSEASGFIKFVYLLSFFALSIQILQFQIINFYKNNDSVYNYFIDNRHTISEYAVNTPPTLGVLATMYAFSEFSTSTGSSLSLMEAFRDSVYDAVSTTIIGGMVFTINMALNIFIQRDIKSYAGDNSDAK
jgi:hypothetical protein